jgi:hypothetical protein
MSAEKNKKLYDGAKKYHGRQGALLNPYLVYVESLYSALYSTKYNLTEKDLTYSVFNSLLDDWINNNRDYDEDLLRNEFRAKYRRSSNVRTVMFGIPTATETIRNFPFKRSLKIKKITFRRRSFKYVNGIEKGRYIRDLSDQYGKERYPDFDYSHKLRNNYIYFTAEVRANSDIVAVNRTLELFQWFAASASVAEERFIHTQSFGYNQTKARKSVTNPGLIYLVDGHPETALYISASYDLAIPTAHLRTERRDRTKKQYKKYLKVFQIEKPTIIDKRIKQVILEFDAALQATDPHTRALNLWRCLELASKKSGQQRTQADVISIFSNFYKDDFWPEIGKLILKARNSYVHEGVELSSETRDHYLIWLQTYASAALSLLFWMKEHHLGETVDQIDNFFDLYSKSDLTLSIAKKMLDARNKSKV